MSDDHAPADADGGVESPLAGGDAGTAPEPGADGDAVAGRTGTLAVLAGQAGLGVVVAAAVTALVSLAGSTGLSPVLLLAGSFVATQLLALLAVGVAAVDGGPASGTGRALLAGWTTLLSVTLGLVGLAVGFVLVLVVLLPLRAAGVTLTPFVLIVASLALVQGVAMGGTALGYLLVRDRLRDGLRDGVRARLGVDLGRTVHDRSWLGVGLPTARDAAAVVLGYAAALGVGVGGAVLVSVLGVEAGSNQAAELASEDPSVLLLLVPASFLLIGPGEELLFRGIVQGRLRAAFSAPVAVGLASAIFAGVHYVALSGSPGQRLVTVAVLLGPAVVFGTAYELTENLAVPSLVHGAYNATLFTMLYLSLRFAPGPGVLSLLPF